MTEIPGVREADEGQLILFDDIYSTPLYSLKTPFEVTGESDSLYIRYISDSEAVLEIYLGDEILQEIILPTGKGIIHYQIPIDSGESVNSFRVRSTDYNKDNSNFRLLSSGIEESIQGLSILSRNDSTETVIREGLEIIDSNTYLFEALSLEAHKRFSQVKISLGYEYIGEGKTEYELILFSDNHEKSFGFNPRRSGAEVHFYSDSLGFTPTGIRSNNTDSDLIIKKIDISSFSTMVPIDYSPVTADIGTMLSYSKSAWRRGDFEIFSWNLFPDILILDFRDYIIQSASLKRLSFFVEKDGFTGKLINNEILSKLHGWNAHDYRAEDLAAFFSKAEEENFELNSEEFVIKDILLSNKIIMKTENGYIPVSGGILSYSIESSPRLRRLFLTHEGYHGIFFSDLEFAAEVQTIWDSLEDTEKQFWYDFLDWKHYEIDNPFLVVNEFMAYLMQQSLENIESYYKDYAIPKYLIALPEKAERMNEFLLNYPDHFLENAGKVEEAAFRLNTITAGELRCIY